MHTQPTIQHMPRVSIGVPVYNGEQYLEAAIDSLLAQTYTDYELIISDNASTDGTAAICQRYAAQDPRIRYYRTEQNRGGAWNFSRTVELARGIYFKWAAHDDVIAPTNLERCVEILDRDPSVILAYPKTIVINEHGAVIATYDDKLDLQEATAVERYQHYHRRFMDNVECNAIFGVFRTDVLRQTPLIAGYMASDKIFLGEIALRGKVYEVPERLFLRRDHPQTTVRALRTAQERMSWYNPAKAHKVQFPRWRWFAEYVRSINRVRMPLQDKYACYREVGKWALRYRIKLVREFAKAIVVYSPLRSLYWMKKGVSA